MADAQTPLRRVWGVFLVFLRLGCTSFGGPVAHLACFRTEFVERLRWLNDHRYTDLVALCQFIPGPASSQVSMVLGWQRAGWGGLAAAWLGFTLPSALLMTGFAYSVLNLAALQNTALWLAVLHGLKLAAAAVVIQAIWSMARSLCPDAARQGLALLTAGLAWVLPAAGMPVAWGQLLAMAACAVVGLTWGARWLSPAAPTSSASEGDSFGLSRGAGCAALLLLVALLLGLPWWATWAESALLAQIAAFFRAGSLVFGGGHVVLPLLQSAVVPTGAVAATDFLAGYGAAQAIPGPLFAFAAYVGAVMHPGVLGPLAPWQGGVLMLLALFAPAMLLVVGLLPFWDALRQRPRMRRAMTGVNAGVVGLLLAALIHPIGPGAVHEPVDLVLLAGALVALLRWRLSPLWVVLGCAILSGLWTAFGP